jgi:hypothetical protein
MLVSFWWCRFLKTDIFLANVGAVSQNCPHVGQTMEWTRVAAFAPWVRQQMGAVSPAH